MTYCHYTKFRKQTKKKHLYIKSALTQINLPDSHLDYIIETQCAHVATVCKRIIITRLLMLSSPWCCNLKLK